MTASPRSLRYDATARSGNSTSASRRFVASSFAVARPARARGRRAVLRCAPDGCPLRSLPLVAGTLHCKRATAYADAPKALVTPAGCARRRCEFWRNPSIPGEGVAARKLMRDGAQESVSALPRCGSGRREGRCEMPRYKSDPRWINVKFDGACVRCKRPIRRGEQAFYFPSDRSLYCESEECGKAASREFGARAFDEENNRCM